MSASILVPFSIARAALSPASAAALDVGHLRRLVRLWTHVGVLVLQDGPQARRQLQELVRQLPQEARKTLGEALVAAEQQRLRVAADAEVPIIYKRCPVDVPDGCGHRASVHAADAVTAASFGRLLPDGFEAATIDLVDATRAFESALTLSSEPVPRHSEVDRAWSQRVAPVLAFARRRVTLVDHYAVSAARRYRDRRRRWEKSGLWRFLREASKHKGVVAIEVIAADDNDRPGSALSGLRECAHELAGDTRRWKLNVFVPQSHRFKKAVHYRSVLVDSASCLLLDSGIEAFDGERVKRTVPTQLVHPRGAIASEIDELRHSVKVVEI